MQDIRTLAKNENTFFKLCRDKKVTETQTKKHCRRTHDFRSNAFEHLRGHV